MKTIYDTSGADEDTFTLDEVKELGREIGATHVILMYEEEYGLDEDMLEEHNIGFVGEDETVNEVVADLDCEYNIINL